MDGSRYGVAHIYEDGREGIVEDQTRRKLVRQPGQDRYDIPSSQPAPALPAIAPAPQAPNPQFRTIFLPLGVAPIGTPWILPHTRTAAEAGQIPWAVPCQPFAPPMLPIPPTSENRSLQAVNSRQDESNALEEGEIPDISMDDELEEDEGGLPY